MNRFLAGVTARAGADPRIHAVKRGRERFKRVEALCGARIAQITGEFIERPSACSTCASVARYVDGGCPPSVDARRRRTKQLPSPPLPLVGTEWRCYVCDRDFLTPERLDDHEVRVHDEDPSGGFVAART